MALFNVLFDIAAKTASFESAMTRVERRMDSVGSYAKKAGAAIGIAFTVGSIKGFIGGAIEAGDAMAKAAQKAGASVEAFSQLAYAAKQSDIELESLSKSIQFMQKAIANGSDSLGEMGINLADIRKLSPDKQFEVLADAIAGIQDPAERTKYVLEVFGKAGADLLPLFEQGASGIRKARAEAEKLGLTLSEESARQLQEADDAIKKLTARWEGFWRTIAIGAARTAEFLNIIDPEESKAQLKQLDELVKRRNDLLSQIRGLQGKGLAQSDIERETELLNKNLARVEAQMNAINETRKKLEEPAPTVTNLPQQTSSASTFKHGLNPQMILEMERNFDWIETRTREAAANAAATAKYNKDVIAGVAEQAAMSVNAWIDETRDANHRQIEELVDSGKAASDAMSTYAEQAARNMQSSLADFLFDPFENGVKGMAKSFIDVIRRMVAEAAAARIFEGLFGKVGKDGGGGAGGFLASVVGGLFGGGKANGGPLESGKWYIAGERGPEPIWGGGPGAYAMGYSGGGGPQVSVTIHNDNRGATADFQRIAPALFKEQAAQLEARIVEGLRRKRYSGL